MSTNTAALKTFAQQTRAKLISLITTKMQFVLNGDTAELRGYEREIGELRKQIREKTEKIVIEEVAYTWFNRVMALRFMDANGYNAPKIVTPATGQTRPEILQDAMSGSIEDELMLTAEEKLLPEAKLYRKLLVAVCNKKMSSPMPFLFEHISDYTELLLPDDLLSDQSFVSDIRNGMTDEDCQNVEIMGWLYQFYITDRKADAETKKSKKGGLKSDEQAAATQLFTPHWIVRYMVENSLGRIWMTLHSDSSLINEMPYYIANPEGQTDTIPDDIHSAKDIRFIDPCMGSGHILVYAFDLLAKMYEEEGEQTKDIPALILENNLYGIDIDRRCYQLASFALTMKARAYYRRYLRNTVNPHVIALEKIERNVIESAGNWDEESLMWQFENIDTIGSLLKITPEECEAITIDNGLFRERQRILKTQAEYLSRRYHCVVTNPPYLGKGMGDSLKDYLQIEYPNSKSDTMATFMERSYEYCINSGKYSMINMQSWMFLPTFEDLRRWLLASQYIDTLIHLGPHTFDELSGEIVQNAAFVITKMENENIDSHTPISSIYINVEDGNNCSEKEKCFLDAIRISGSPRLYRNVNQNNFETIPGCPIAYDAPPVAISLYTRPLVGNNAQFKRGIGTGGNDRFLRIWFEISINSANLFGKDHSLKWQKYNKGGSRRKWYGNRDYLINWENDGFEIKNNYGENGRLASRPQNLQYNYKKNLSYSSLSSDILTFRVFEDFLNDQAGNYFILNEGVDFDTMLSFMNSKIASFFKRIKNRTLNITSDDLMSIPYLMDDNFSCSEKVEENINISKRDWDSHETSWDFQQNELIRIVSKSIDDGLKREFMLESILNKYKTEWTNYFIQLHQNEEDINRQFIEIYGLQNELTPNVPLSEITILQQGEISIDDTVEPLKAKIVWHNDIIIKQLISYLIGCFMGRYSVNKPGLIIASQGQKPEDLDLPVQTLEIDDDGIIPIIQEEDFFADDMTQRIEAAVKTLFGEEHFYENMKFVKQCLGMNLRGYLYKNYYADHQQMYSVKGAKRPIYWLFSSQMGDKKKKGYFKALVYMHRLEADTLSKLHADYVHPYIQKIEHQLIEAEDNATRDDLSQAQHNKALKLAEELREKVREVKAFETTLVEMASARITIDLDDGVKANYPKFYPLVEPIKGLDNKEED